MLNGTAKIKVEGWKGEAAAKIGNQGINASRELTDRRSITNPTSELPLILPCQKVTVSYTQKPLQWGLLCHAYCESKS